MVFLVNPPGQESLKDQHAWEGTKTKTREERRQGRPVYYFLSDRLKRVKKLFRKGRRKEVSILNQLVPEGGGILDLGCAQGTTLRALAGRQWVPHGIEPSPGLARDADDFCQSRGGRVVQDTSVGGLPKFKDDYFDVVMMRSYLEHEVFAKEVLTEVHRVLKRGGKGLIKVPNTSCFNALIRGAGWPGVRHPDHVNYFTPRHLLRIVEASGFSKIHFPRGWRLPTSDNLWMMIEKT